MTDQPTLSDRLAKAMNRVAEAEHHVTLLLLEDCALARQEELSVANGGVPAAEAKRHGELEAELPFLVVAAEQVVQRAVELGRGVVVG